jgi:hypothetical protein
MIEINASAVDTIKINQLTTTTTGGEREKRKKRVSVRIYMLFLKCLCTCAHTVCCVTSDAGELFPGVPD